MKTYIISEVLNGQRVKADSVVECGSLLAAKRVASRLRSISMSYLRVVAEGSDGRLSVVAEKRGNRWHNKQVDA
jgi:hypothetical protein